MTSLRPEHSSPARCGIAGRPENLAGPRSEAGSIPPALATEAAHSLRRIPHGLKRFDGPPNFTQMSPDQGTETCVRETVPIETVPIDIRWKMCTPARQTFALDVTNDAANHGRATVTIFRKEQIKRR